MRHSYTKISTYMKCPAQKRYRYDERIPSPPSPSAARGTAYHSAIERSIRDSNQPIPPELSYYTDYLGRLRTLGAKPEFKFAVDKNWEPVTWDDSPWIIGVADVWVPSIPTAHVQDWKTGKIYDDHEKQGEFYSLCLFSSAPEAHEIKATFIYTDLKKERNKTYHRDQLQQLRDRWTARIERMERDTECVPTPGAYCNWCPFSKAKGGPCRF